MTDWPHQVQAVDRVADAIRRVVRRILLTMPTGAGKTRVAVRLMERFCAEGKKTLLLTNRKLLVQQTSETLAAAGIDHGVRAAGWSAEGDVFDVQISSIQTEHERSMKRKTVEPFAADYLIIDEAHLFKGETAQDILEAYIRQGATYIGLTATPLDIGYLYDELIQAGSVSECRKVGALVPAIHYGPDEPDYKRLKRRPEGGHDPSAADQRLLIMTPTIFGRAGQWYLKLNPKGLPALLFAPGVEESIWFAEQFSCPERRHPSLRHLPAIPAAHIDSEDVWYDGKLRPRTDALWKEIRSASESGALKLVTNRFVLREGIDWPWIQHMILAFVAGSLQTYLQTVGRGLRAYPGKERLIVQDHGGNWWRHGSVNADREWFLESSAPIHSGLREDQLRHKKCRRCGERLIPGNQWCPKCSLCNEVEPALCPQCRLVLVIGKCPGCGLEIPKKQSRPVVGTDGEVREMTGDIFKARSVCKRTDGPALWERMIYRALSARWDATFRSAEFMFASENHWQWPSKDWPLMPKHKWDWFRKVRLVPLDRLTGDPALHAKVIGYCLKRDIKHASLPVPRLWDHGA